MIWKLNRLLLYFIFLIFVILNILSFSIISVADSLYNIEVVEKDYQFLRTAGSENLKFNYYTITIRLKNNGAEKSDDITLKIWEKEEGENISILRNASIKPGETIAFRFVDWIVQGIGEHTVMYEYYPTDITKINSYNSGKGFFNINDGSIKQDNNTPGFELFIFLVAFISLFLIEKKKR
jgi:hypothetical protein